MFSNVMLCHAVCHNVMWCSIMLGSDNDIMLSCCLYKINVRWGKVLSAWQIVRSNIKLT